MQRQAIAVLSMLLVAVALAACGDGEETTVSTSATQPVQGRQAPEQVQGRGEGIEKERGAQSSGGDGQKGAGEGPSQAPAPALSTRHQDSGGGAVQFQRKGSDNSIQEFGQEGGGSEFANAAATLHGYLDARAAGRWEDACSYLAAEVIASIEQFAAANAETQLEGCPQILQTFSSGAGAAGLRAAANVDVGSLRVEGGRGFLLYHGPQGVDFAMPVVLQSGEWKLSAPEATPLP